MAAASLVTKTGVAEWVRDLGLGALGLQIGSTLTPETASRLAGLPLAALGLAVATITAMGLAYSVLRRLARWDPATAFLAAAPGAFSTTLALVAVTQADDRRVITAQTLRLAVLVALLPLVFVAEPAGPASATWAWRDAAITLPAAAAAGFALQRVGAPAAWILGPAGVSAVLSASGLTTGQPPVWAFHGGLLIIGAASGARVRGGGGARGTKLTRKDFIAMTAALIVMLSATTAIAAVTAALTPLSFTALMLAYTPGGFEAMVALAAALDLEPALVSAAHVARVLALTVTMPWLCKLAAPSPSPNRAAPSSAPPDGPDARVASQTPPASETKDADAGVGGPTAR